jgi:hypothetical protein
MSGCVEEHLADFVIGEILWRWVALGQSPRAIIITPRPSMVITSLSHEGATIERIGVVMVEAQRTVKCIEGFVGSTGVKQDGT